MRNPFSDRDKSQSPSAPERPQRSASPVEWSSRHGFQAFGDRLNFLSPERQHLQTGTLRILPPANPEKRKKNG